MKTRNKIALGVGGVVAGAGVAFIIKKLIEVRNEFKEYDPNYEDSFINPPKTKVRKPNKKTK